MLTIAGIDETAAAVPGEEVAVSRVEIQLNRYATEDALLDGLRTGDPDACTCLVKRFSALVYSHALRMLHDPDEAEGILQSTFIKACNKVQTFEGRSELGTWIYRIATNEALMTLRQRKIWTTPIDTISETLIPADAPLYLRTASLDPARIVLDTEIRSQLAAALQALPETLRIVFMLREMYGLSTTETAQRLGLGESAVKVRLHRARLRLRELLADYFGVYGEKA